MAFPVYTPSAATAAELAALAAQQDAIDNALTAMYQDAAAQQTALAIQAAQAGAGAGGGG